MRTITTAAYRYEELDAVAQSEARDWLRGCGWYPGEPDGAAEDFKEIAEIIGLRDVEVFWSGFGCQGDGASFTGRYEYRPGAAKELRVYAPLDETLAAIAAELQELQRRLFYRYSCRIATDGHYCHSGAMSVVDDCETANHAREFLAIFRRLADWHYAQLESEYCAMMSDEACAEYLTTNGHEFTADGDALNPKRGRM